jgi:hypothetical protein
MTCVGCGCTDDRACATPDGPCFWVGPELCSSCATAAEDLYRRAKEEFQDDEEFDPDDRPIARRLSGRVAFSAAAASHLDLEI